MSSAEKLEPEKIPTKNLTECTFYLHNYGTHKSVIEFYLRFQRVLPAIEFCIESDVKPGPEIIPHVDPLT